MHRLLPLKVTGPLARVKHQILLLKSVNYFAKMLYKFGQKIIILVRDKNTSLLCKNIDYYKHLLKH